MVGGNLKGVGNRKVISFANWHSKLVRTEASKKMYQEYSI
jgi:hypothetical protein